MRPGANGEEKRTNEIGTIIPLIDMLPDIRGRIVTADAMLTQRKLAAYLLDRGAEYAFTVLCHVLHKTVKNNCVKPAYHQKYRTDLPCLQARHSLLHGRERPRHPGYKAFRQQRKCHLSLAAVPACNARFSMRRLAHIRSMPGEGNALLPVQWASSQRRALPCLAGHVLRLRETRDKVQLHEPTASLRASLPITPASTTRLLPKNLLGKERPNSRTALIPDQYNPGLQQTGTNSHAERCAAAPQAMKILAVRGVPRCVGLTPDFDCSARSRLAETESRTIDWCWR